MQAAGSFHLDELLLLLVHLSKTASATALTVSQRRDHSKELVELNRAVLVGINFIDEVHEVLLAAVLAKIAQDCLKLKRRDVTIAILVERLELGLHSVQIGGAEMDSSHCDFRTSACECAIECVMICV